jgi:hypothetical protein
MSNGTDLVLHSFLTKYGLLQSSNALPMILISTDLTIQYCVYNMEHPLWGGDERESNVEDESASIVVEETDCDLRVCVRGEWILGIDLCQLWRRGGGGLDELGLGRSWQLP